MSPEVLPLQLAGWTAVKTVPLHVAKDLYEYMDGGAELYLSYGVADAISRTYSSPQGDSEVIAEFYDMAESRNAFGVFTQVREDETRLFGQATYSIPGAVLFWKGRYYISISSWTPSKESDIFIKELAAFIDNKINEYGDIPEIVSMLPSEGLITAGYRYFRHHVWINSYFFITDENIFTIDENTDAVIARYEDENDQKRFLLLIKYSHIKEAEEAFEAFGKEFFPEGLINKCHQTAEGKWLATDLSGNFLIAVFNASSRENAFELLSRTGSEIAIKNR